MNLITKANALLAYSEMLAALLVRIIFTHPNPPRSWVVMGAASSEWVMLVHQTYTTMQRTVAKKIGRLCLLKIHNLSSSDRHGSL